MIKLNKLSLRKFNRILIIKEVTVVQANLCQKLYLKEILVLKIVSLQKMIKKIINH